MSEVRLDVTINHDLSEKGGPVRHARSAADVNGYEQPFRSEGSVRGGGT